MNRQWIVLICLTCLASVASAQLVVALQGNPKPKPEPKGPKLVTLEARPAVPPDPAMSVRLLPGILDQKPGNAAQLYYRTMSSQSARLDGLRKKVSRWLELPPQELLEEPNLPAGSALLEAIARASRREYCRWDFPIREEGFGLLLPSLGQYRDTAKLLSVRIRVHIAKRDFEKALEDLQTGLAMSRHVAEGPTLIQALVGTATAEIMLIRAEELMQAPGAPNLYWALADLPRPFIDLRGAMAFEHASLYLALPKLRDLTRRRLSPQQWQAVTDDLAKLLAEIGVGSFDGSDGSSVTRLGLTAAAVYYYPRAKKYMLSKGYTPKQIDAMPVQQVCIAYSLEPYEHHRDEMFKWFSLPYWQAREGMARSLHDFRAAYKQHRGNPFFSLLPTLGRAHFIVTKVDRHVAALQALEAVRAYAAAHEGRPPKSLADVTDTPAPIDPVTGKRFVYKVEGDTVTLDASAPDGLPARDGSIYRLTLLAEKAKETSDAKNRSSADAAADRRDSGPGR